MLSFQDCARIQHLCLTARPPKIAGNISAIIVDPVEAETGGPRAEFGIDIGAEHLDIEPWRMEEDASSAISMEARVGWISSALNDVSMGAVEHPVAFSTETMLELQCGTDFTLQASARQSVPAIEIAVQNGFERTASAVAQPSQFRARVACCCQDGEAPNDTTGLIDMSGHGGD
jgi:hypothetical protein